MQETFDEATDDNSAAYVYLAADPGFDATDVRVVPPQPKRSPRPDGQPDGFKSSCCLRDRGAPLKNLWPTSRRFPYFRIDNPSSTRKAQAGEIHPRRNLCDNPANDTTT